MNFAVLSAAFLCVVLATDAAKVDKCAAVKCTECRQCKLNDHGEPKCVYQQGCPCPGNAPQANCFVSPCHPSIQQKNSPKAAHCIEDYCGGCHAHYYDADWNEIGGSSKLSGSRKKRDNHCSEIRCPGGKKCIPSPKQCLATPCAEYECI